ncbi:hypothetical protein CTI12_AA046690 [Artemisia annua]|uniref:Uncharacterized protein n=1 Tax=Artemisia annua TaxID=35608 RepID=A0A2U1QC29_ARTAN|nr:hypothetical protein CTI12_AA046690 [Artemisia annua]
MANDNAVHVEVDVIEDAVKNILECVEKRQEQPPTNKTLPSIFTVPSIMRDANPRFFKPQMVSIGPLHHREDEKVQEYERRKATYLHDYLRRINSPLEETLKACVRKVNASMDQIRACYAEIKRYSDVELEAMMVMDACFILECHYKVSEQDEETLSLIPHLVRDLVMLENQIPFFVLRDMFKCTYLKLKPRASLTCIVLDLIKIIYPFDYSDLHIDDDKNYSHVLDLLHKLFRPKYASPPTKNAPQSLLLFSAAKLSNAGLKFKPNQDADFRMDMKFESSWSNTTLTMPKLRINIDTEIVFHNLIAYEQCLRNVDSYISSYVTAMNILVDRKEDLQVLVQSKVIIDNGYDDQYAFDLLRRLWEDATIIQDFTYISAWVKMDEYCNHGFGWIRQTYFSGKWSYIASVSGLIIFILTSIQTFCAIRGL